MPPITYPNQRMVKIHRESVKTDFLGIKNENWQAASRDLGAHALQLYLYLASNANNYTVALSPVAVRQAIGMARSTYHDQFHKLVDKGYLVPLHGNTFAFYEVPQSATQAQNAMLDDGLDFEKSPSHGSGSISVGQSILPENIEINNTAIPNKMEINNQKDEGKAIVQKPQVKEVVISRPIAEGKGRPKPIEQPKKEVFSF